MNDPRRPKHEWVSDSAPVAVGAVLRWCVNCGYSRIRGKGRAPKTCEPSSKFLHREGRIEEAIFMEQVENSIPEGWVKGGEFQSFEEWVNKAPSRIGGMGARCYDTKGRRCFIGADMHRARDEGAFPVSYWWKP